MVYLQQHLEKYPKMQLVDIVKLYFQGIMGPAHLFIDEQNALRYLEQEYEQMDVDTHEMVEEISQDYVRVYIYPYFQKFGSFAQLAKAFKCSAEQKRDVNIFLDTVRSLMNDSNRKVLQQYIDDGHYAVSHSEIYRKHYNPHYRVVSKKYLKIALGESMKPTVFFTKEITKEAVVRLYQHLNKPLKGNVCIKVHSGEPGNQNFLRPDFWADIINEVKGTVVECNTAYEGRRNTTEAHLQTFKDHGWDQFNVDLMDSEGPDMVLEIPDGNVIKKNYVGKHLANYDSMLVLSHFKGHPMGGYGGALKQLSIGVASSYGKAYIHGAGDVSKIWTADHNSFLASMADAAKSVVDYFHGNIVYINVMKNMSVDCDCCSVAEDPCIKDIGMLISTDPVAIDQACIDLVYNCDDPKKGHLIERIESRNGIHTIEKAAELGYGSREYQLVNLDNE